MHSVSHPLALYMLAQMQVKSFSARDVVIAMGYPDRPQSRLTGRACIRLQTVLDDALLGLGYYSGGFDLKFTAEAFLLAALDVLDVRHEVSAPYLEELRVLRHQQRWFYRLSAGIDAGTAWRNRTPRFLAGMAVFRNRHVTLPDDVARLSEAQRLAVLLNAMKYHYRQYADTLPHDARITGYCLRRIRLDGRVDGQLFFPVPV